ncbi:pulmonary surfactant-associated protein C-like [Cuculus canorus]|uniref:pulmonary surfactant-associated protein C-like n=1 Tax=Cuculus canorus TaxID=55661 RepID=UPI0023AA9D27|nr:pulmonary surfactant-associated protein C-like [Cuculus canorus]
MESSMKPVVVEEPADSEKGCCGPGCCMTCCAKCARCCCLPSCCKCPKCLKCPGCGSCGGCGGCIKRSICCLPRLLCYLPRKILKCRSLKCLLIVVVVVILLVVIIAGALLMWLRADDRHADNILWMAAEGLRRRPAWEEDVATFYLASGDGNPAMVIYDYKNLLVSYRSWLHHACYITRVDKDNIPGLDTITKTFQRRQDEQRLAVPLADRSLLGTTASILCSLIPIYWA